MSPLDRRTFLTIGAAAAVTTRASAQTSAANTATAPSSSARLALEKSLLFGMIGGGGTLLEKLKRARAAGFSGVELDSPAQGFTVDEALAALAESGMRVADVVDSVHWSKPLSSPDASVRDAGRAALEGALRDARRYGTDSVLLVPAIVNAEVSYAEAWERSTAEITKVLPLAAELKVHVAIENVWNNFLLSPLEAARYVDQFASPWVGWHFDVGNVVLYGWPEQWLRTLGKRVKRLHVKEYSRKQLDELGRWKGFDVELGEGDCRWPEVLRALADIGYAGWASAEVAGGAQIVAAREPQFTCLLQKLRGVGESTFSERAGSGQREHVRRSTNCPVSRRSIDHLRRDRNPGREGWCRVQSRDLAFKQRYGPRLLAGLHVQPNGASCLSAPHQVAREAMPKRVKFTPTQDVGSPLLQELAKEWVECGHLGSIRYRAHQQFPSCDGRTETRPGSRAEQAIDRADLEIIEQRRATEIGPQFCRQWGEDLLRQVAEEARGSLLVPGVGRAQRTSRRFARTGEEHEARGPTAKRGLTRRVELEAIAHFAEQAPLFAVVEFEIGGAEAHHAPLQLVAGQR